MPSWSSYTIPPLLILSQCQSQTWRKEEGGTNSFYDTCNVVKQQLTYANTAKCRIFIRYNCKGDRNQKRLWSAGSKAQFYLVEIILELKSGGKCHLEALSVWETSGEKPNSTWEKDEELPRKMVELTGGKVFSREEPMHAKYLGWAIRVLTQGTEAKLIRGSKRTKQSDRRAKKEITKILRN